MLQFPEIGLGTEFTRADVIERLRAALANAQSMNTPEKPVHETGKIEHAVAAERKDMIEILEDAVQMRQRAMRGGK
jgi:hypothetical protein